MRYQSLVPKSMTSYFHTLGLSSTAPLVPLLGDVAHEKVPTPRSISDKTPWQLLGGQCHNLGSFPCRIIVEFTGEGQMSWLYSIFELRNSEGRGPKVLACQWCDRRQPLQRTLLGCRARSREQGTFYVWGKRRWPTQNAQSAKHY